MRTSIANLGSVEVLGQNCYEYSVLQVVDMVRSVSSSNPPNY
jgi:hypothetical protein